MPNLPSSQYPIPAPINMARTIDAPSCRESPTSFQVVLVLFTKSKSLTDERAWCQDSYFLAGKNTAGEYSTHRHGDRSRRPYHEHGRTRLRTGRQIPGERLTLCLLVPMLCLGTHTLWALPGKEANFNAFRDVEPPRMRSQAEHGNEQKIGHQTVITFRNPKKRTSHA